MQIFLQNFNFFFKNDFDFVTNVQVMQLELFNKLFPSSPTCHVYDFESIMYCIYVNNQL